MEPGPDSVPTLSLPRGAEVLVCVTDYVATFNSLSGCPIWGPKSCVESTEQRDWHVLPDAWQPVLLLSGLSSQAQPWTRPFSHGSSFSRYIRGWGPSAPGAQEGGCRHSYSHVCS